MRKRLLWLIPLIFVVVNVVLLVKDDGEKVERLNYVKKWEVAQGKDLKETLATEGTFDFINEYPVFIDEEAGAFDEFSVTVGDTVESGEPLFSYKVRNYFERLATLENEKQAIEQKVTAAQQAADEMQGVVINESTIRIMYPDGSEAGTIPSDTTFAESAKEQYMIDKNKEVRQLEAELTSVDAELSDLAAGKDTIVVGSPYDGKVIDISESLDNPVITIGSEDLHVTGTLSESERMKVSEGMSGDVTLLEKEAAEPLSGTLTFLSEQAAEVDSDESTYAWELTLEEEEDQSGMLQGYHADVVITLAESPNATAIKSRALVEEKEEDFVWHMQRSGILKKQAVSSGVEMDPYVEITSGLEKNESVLLETDKRLYESPFITPFKPSKAKWKEIWQDGPRKRSIFIGLLGR